MHIYTVLPSKPIRVGQWRSPPFTFIVNPEKQCFTTLLTKHHVLLMHSFTLNIYPGETLYIYYIHTYQSCTTCTYVHTITHNIIHYIILTNTYIHTDKSGHRKEEFTEKYYTERVI